LQLSDRFSSFQESVCSCPMRTGATCEQCFVNIVMQPRTPALIPLPWFESLRLLAVLSKMVFDRNRYGHRRKNVFRVLADKRFEWTSNIFKNASWFLCGHFFHISAQYKIAGSVQMISLHYESKVREHYDCMSAVDMLLFYFSFGHNP
jgi:hypothetical protein